MFRPKYSDGKKRSIRGGKKRKGMTDGGLEKIAGSLAKPVEIKLSFTRSDEEGEDG